MACDAPLSIKYDPPIQDGKGGFIYYFPADCGKCIPCLIKRKSQWSYRLVEQMRVSFSAYFVTLTYDNSHLPYGDFNAIGNKNDHRHFMKWLKYYDDPERLAKRDHISINEFNRATNDKGKISYYGCLEYGDENKRPHMHYILFNVRDTDSIGSAWAEQIKIKPKVYKPGFSYGRIQIDDCNVNTIDYVLKYMVKERGDYDDSMEKERSWMSKGLGNITTPEFVRYINEERGNVVVSQRGTKVALPRYFRKKYVSEEASKKKAAYIAEYVKKQDEKIKRMVEGQNGNYDEYIAKGKDNRLNNLKKRKHRSL